jgi:hypothetical protein
MIEDEDGSIQADITVSADIESTVAFTLISEGVRLGHVSLQ